MHKLRIFIFFLTASTLALAQSTSIRTSAPVTVTDPQTKVVTSTLTITVVTTPPVVVLPTWITVALEGATVECKKGCTVRYGIDAKSLYNPTVIYNGDQTFTVNNTTFPPDPFYGTVKNLQVLGDTSAIYVNGVLFSTPPAVVPPPVVTPPPVTPDPPPVTTVPPPVVTTPSPPQTSLYPDASNTVAEAIALATPAIQALPEFDSDRGLLLELLAARDDIRIGSDPATITGWFSTVEASLDASGLDPNLVSTLKSKLSTAGTLVTASPVVSSTP